MLKQLKRRFVCVLMALVTLTLCAIFGFLYHFTRVNLEKQCVSMMESVAKNPFQQGLPGIWSESVRLPYFVIKVTARGEITAVSGGNYDLTDTVFLDNLIDAAIHSADDLGSMPEYGLRYLRVKTPGALALVFADTTSETATLHSLAKNCLLIGAGCLAVFFGIALLLARWTARPVEKAWAQQRQFVSDASHELKTPLTVILTMSHQMRALVEDLLELARNDNGKSKMVPETLDFSALAEDGMLPFEAVFYERGLTLESDIQPGITLTGSRQHLEQVLDILLDNARKYASTGTVTVTLFPWGRHHCRLCVSNECEALSPEELKSIFKRFYRRDAARSRDGSFGLGLSIAESIVNAHGGKIWAGWEAGRITFTAELPTK